MARVFLAAEDTVLVEEPTYLGALQVFRRAGVRLVGVPVDEEGLQVETLEPILARVRPRLLYTQPTFQNPTGAQMSLPRRKRLLELAWRHQLPILEEDVYGDIRYEGPTLPSLRALDSSGQVLQVGSFSKTLCPGLRIGWLNGPASAIRQLAVARQTVDLHTATMNQWVVQRFLSEGLLTRHVEKIRPETPRVATPCWKRWPPWPAWGCPGPVPKAATTSGVACQTTSRCHAWLPKPRGRALPSCPGRSARRTAARPAICA